MSKKEEEVESTVQGKEAQEIDQGQMVQPLRSAKFGLYSCLMTMIVVLASILICLIAQKINFKFDLTQDKMYSLSKETQALLAQNEKEVSLFGVYEQGKEDVVYKEILENYARASKKIHVQMLSPYENPQMFRQFAVDGQEPALGSVIVESQGNFRVISPAQLSNYVQDEYSGGYYIESSNIENCVSGAISYLTREDIRPIYSIKGQGESDLDKTVVSRLENLGLSFADLDISLSGEIPKNAAMLLINSPMQDFSEAQITQIKAYLDQGGSALILMGITSVKLPHLNALVGEYGLQPNYAMTIEGDPGFVLQNNPYYLKPSLLEHEITKVGMENAEAIFFPYAQGFEQSESKKSNVEIKPLLQTSDMAYGKKEIVAMEEYPKAEGDLEGPFQLAFACSKKQADQQSRLVVLGGNSLLDTTINEFARGANASFFSQCVKWLTQADNAVIIAPKTLGVDRSFALDKAQGAITMGLGLLLLPFAIIMALGIGVTLRRKKK